MDTHTRDMDTHTRDTDTHTRDMDTHTRDMDAHRHVLDALATAIIGSLMTFFVRCVVQFHHQVL